MTPSGRLVTWQTLVFIVTVAVAMFGVAWTLDARIDERVRPVATDVREVRASYVPRGEFVEVKDEVRTTRETISRMAADLAAIRAIVETERGRRR